MAMSSEEHAQDDHEQQFVSKADFMKLKSYVQQLLVSVVENSNSVISFCGTSKS